MSDLQEFQSTQDKAFMIMSKERLNYISKTEKQKYRQWYKQNLKHLNIMYDIADIEFSFNIFCKYVYSNSIINT